MELSRGESTRPPKRKRATQDSTTVFETIELLDDDEEDLIEEPSTSKRHGKEKGE